MKKKVHTAPPFKGLAIQLMSHNTIEVEFPTTLSYYEAVDINGKTFYPNTSSHAGSNVNKLTYSTYTLAMRAAVNPVRIYF
ncbi:hypothetical protein [Lysinibacillus sphaericus]|uniref:hypothetical protein n=1 Tax=Lysinibacillus sphaericus TaxID=1421 RepID=UPI003D08D589